MARNSYVPGEWFGIVRSGTVVVLGPGTEQGLVQSLWELLGRAPEIHEVLNEVTEGFGVSLTRIPAFGIIDAKDALRVVLRGDVELDTADGSQGIHGRDVTTWAERRMELPASYRLRIGATTDGADGAALPLQEGVVLLSGLEAVLSPGEEASPAGGAEEAVIAGVPVAVAPAASTAAPVSAAPVGAAEPVAAEEPAEAAEPVAAAPEGPEDETAAVSAAVPTDIDADSPETLMALEEHDEHDEHEDHGGQEGGAPETDAPEGELPDDLELTIAPSQLREDTDGAAAVVPEPLAETAVEAEVPAEEVGVDTGATTDEMVQNLEQTSSYDHLWERTVIRNIEDAAVRINPDEEHEEPAAPAPQLPPAEPAAPPAEQQEARPQLPVQPPAPAPAAPQAAPPQGTPPQGSGLMSGGLISSVPWLSGNSAPAAPAAPPPAPMQGGLVPPPQWSPPGTPQGAPGGFVPGGFPVEADADEDSDHDGHTIMKSSLANLSPAPAPAAAAAGSELLPDGTKRPLVLARVCPQGHANPPTYSQCQSCGTALSGDGVQVPRPSLGKVRLSTGEVIELDRSLIIGRQPSVSRVQGGGMPALVQVESPGGDISRSHVEVRLEGWHVMLCDLKATNGTVLVREGQPPRRLAQNEMAIVLDGDIAELGDNISLRFEEIL
ncbi:hypothetical protein BIU82_17810 [Arthrobacter sp. SW1]|uniref:FHA domain-containing protein n=1 Tax=Arthrobacter sp. SW1 TaxID=1920889 RepID=UPI000877E24B|nr:FHA domain-containing protein [Arthrobacter sp. SW1]OFI38719.1 hypothetical protein BIU82_17810 [Arthrobacter sp. SW1]